MVQLRTILLHSLMISWQIAFCQTTVWQETFSYLDGTTTGANLNRTNPAADWTSGGCLACLDTADWWEIKNGALEARDVNEVVFLQTEIIDISQLSDVQFSVEISELGDHEGLYFGLDACADQDKEDYVNVLYRLDAGPWNLVANALNWCGLYAACGSHTLYGDDGINSGDCRDHDDDWGVALISNSNLSGNQLEIRIEAINSATDEIIRIDNLIIQGMLSLPVELSSFQAKQVDNRVLLTWKTISETDNDYFEVQRKMVSESHHWETIAIVDGQGTSHHSQHYHYTDLLPLPGSSLYRLKQVDFDGKFEFSDLKTVVIKPRINPFPNPASDFVVVPITNTTRLPQIITAYDISGAKICVEYENKNNYIILDIRILKSGYYTYTLNNKNYRLWVIK